MSWLTCCDVSALSHSGKVRDEPGEEMAYAKENSRPIENPFLGETIGPGRPFQL
jgi:hypothetical protein